MAKSAIGWRSGIGRWTAAATAAVVVGALVQVTTLASPAHAAPGCPAEQANDAAALAAAHGCRGRVEVTARRSETTQVWANPDGSFTAQIYPGPVRMRDAKGNWVAVDLTLRANADGSVTPKAHPNGLRLSGAAGAGTHEVVSVSANGHRIGLGWDGALPKPVLSANTATYPNVRPGVDLVVTANRVGYEESLVVKDGSGVDSVASLSLPLQTPGLTLTRDSAGNGAFHDSSGAVVATTGAPEMFDAARDDHNQPLHHMVVPSRGGPVASRAGAGADGGADSGHLALSPDMSFLRDPSRQFPITIDPSINPMYSTADTYIKSNDTVDRSGASDIELGTYGGAGGVARGLITWPTGDLRFGTVTSATVYLWNWWSESCTPNQWEIWTTGQIPGGVLWSNQPSWLNKEATSTQTKGYSSACDDGWVSIDGRSFFQRAADANTPYGYMGVRASNESDNYSWKQFRSRNFSNTALQEYAVVNYSSQPRAGSTGTPKNATQTSFALTDRLTAQVNVASGNLLVESRDLTLPGINGDVTLGTAYNSQMLGTDLQNVAFGPGWRTLTGQDVRLVPNSDGSVTYVAAGGDVGKFTSSGSTSYNSPSEFTATLTKQSGGGWTLTDHQSNAKTTFDSSGTPTSIADRNGNTINLSSTSISSTRGGSGAHTAAISSNGSGQITSYQQTGDNSIGTRTVTYTYPGPGAALGSITDATHAVTGFGYDGANNLTDITVTGPGGGVEKTHIDYDGVHRVTAVTRNPGGASQAVTRFSYPKNGQTLLADPDRSTGGYAGQDVSAVPHTTYNYDTNTLRVTSTTDADGHGRSKTYTPFEDVNAATDGLSQTTTGTYTDNGGESLNKVTSPTGASNSFTYSSANAAAKFNPATATDGQNNTNSYTYDGAGNLTQGKTADAATAKVTRNSDGTVKDSTDPANSVSTTYGYTDHESTTVTPPPGYGLNPTTITWDGYGRVQSVTDGRGLTTTYSYDLDDRVTKVCYSDGTTAVTYDHDGFGNITSRTDTTGTTTYGFDALNRLTSRSADAGGGTEGYSYDPSGNLKTVTDGRGTTSYGYDNANLLTSMTTAKGTLLNYANDANGKRTDTWFATNSGNTSWAAHSHTDYDHSGRPSHIWTATGSNDSTKAQDLSYSFAWPGSSGCSLTGSGDTSLVQTVADHVANTTTTYCYDHSNRLTKATVSGSTSKTYSYGYDANGNRTSASDGATSLSYNPVNEVTNSGYGYDAAGNQTQDPTIGTMAYNAAGQMTCAGGNSYTYAGSDQRELVHESTSTGTVDFTYGRTDQFGNPLVQSYRIAGKSNPIYLDYDPTGAPQVLTADVGTESFIALDDIGSPVALVKTDSSKLGAYSYDPFGRWTDTNFTGGQSTPENPYRFAIGGTYDQGGTGLIHDGQRWYNPNVGRFTQQDTIVRLADPVSGNRFAYAGDDPINQVDPTGMCTVVDWLYGISSVLGGVALLAASVPADSIAIGFLGQVAGVSAIMAGSAGIGYCATH